MPDSKLNRPLTHSHLAHGVVYPKAVLDGESRRGRHGGYQIRGEQVLRGWAGARCTDLQQAPGSSISLRAARLKRTPTSAYSWHTGLQPPPACRDTNGTLDYRWGNGPGAMSHTKTYVENGTRQAGHYFSILLDPIHLSGARSKRGRGRSRIIVQRLEVSHDMLLGQSRNLSRSIRERSDE